MKKLHLDIFHTYTKSWIEKDVSLFLSLLDEKVTITECFGYQYIGKNECEKWFNHWNNSSENQVNRWEITNDYYDETQNTSIFEWLFDYKYKDERNIFSGATVLKLRNGKIINLKEFEAKTEVFRPFA